MGLGGETATKCQCGAIVSPHTIEIPITETTTAIVSALYGDRPAAASRLLKTGRITRCELPLEKLSGELEGLYAKSEGFYAHRAADRRRDHRHHRRDCGSRPAPCPYLG